MPTKMRRRRSNLAKKVKNIINSQKENKSECQGVASTAIAATWTALPVPTDLHLNGITEGTAENQRIGLDVLSRGIQIKLQVACASDRPQSIRFFLVQKKQSFSTSTELPGQTGSVEMIGCVTPKLKVLYNVLWDRTYSIQPFVDDSGTSLFRHFYINKFIKINKRLHFDGNTSADLDKGRVLLYAVTDNLAGGVDDVDVALQCVHHYKDI